MKKVAEIVQKLVYCCLPQSKINVSLEAEKNSSNVDFLEKYLRQKAKLHFFPRFFNLVCSWAHA